MTALVALTAVGVDVGHLAFTATEVQNLADVAATSGAQSLVIQGEGTAQSGAQLALKENYIDGAKAHPSHLQSLVLGNYNYDANTFQVGGAPANAVRATTGVTVNNLLGSVFGSPHSAVTRNATASFVSIGAGFPQLPITIGECAFDEDDDDDCLGAACLPTAIQVPSTQDNSAWTGFFAGANTSTITGLFPAACNGGGDPIPLIKVGDPINLNNGQIGPLLSRAEDCFAGDPSATYVVPVIECVNFVQDVPVLGFATVKITDVV